MTQKGSGILKALGLESFLEASSNNSSSKEKSIKKKEKPKLDKKKYKSSLLTRSKRSESKLIHKYEDYRKASKQYSDSYTGHLENLISLDDKMNMNGLQSTFKSYLSKKEFSGNETVDKTNPLFLRNYLVSSVTPSNEFRKENLKRQIYYLLTKFSANDSNLIKGFDIMANKTQSKEIIIVFRCVDNELYERTIDLNKKYLLNLKKLKSIIIDICKLVKKNIGYNFKEKNEDFLFRNNNVIRMPGMNNMNSTNISKLLKSNISNVKPASKSLNDNNNKNNIKSDLTSVKLNSDPIIPLSQLDSTSNSVEISKNSSSESSNKKAKVKLFGDRSKTKKLSKKNNNNNEKLSQGFRRLDPEKPLDINKGLNDLIKGVELKEEDENSSNYSRDKRTRRKSKSRERSRGRSRGKSRGRSRTRRNSRDKRTRQKSRTRSRNRYRVI